MGIMSCVNMFFILHIYIILVTGSFVVLMADRITQLQEETNLLAGYMCDSIGKYYCNRRSSILS